MQMLYNSDQFAVVAFDLAGPRTHAAGDTTTAPSPEPAQAAEAAPTLGRGGYEIVDKMARKGIYLEGALAEHFQQGVQAIVDRGPSQEALDEFIAGFTVLAQQPLVLH